MQLSREWRSTFCIRIVEQAHGIIRQIHDSISRLMLRISHYREI